MGKERGGGGGIRQLVKGCRIDRSVIVLLLYILGSLAKHTKPYKHMWLTVLTCAMGGDYTLYLNVTV